MHAEFIPLAKPYLNHLEEDAVLAVLRSGVLSMGKFTIDFEHSFAEMMGGGYAVSVSSGTAALHLAIRLLSISSGDEVITTPFSFVASANCMLFEKAIPRFVDIEEKTLGLNPELITNAITKKTKAVLPVHVFGRPCAIAGVVSIANDHGLEVIEDACEAIRSSFNNRLIGTFGKISVFGFYPNKQLTTGEGGILFTQDEKIAHLARSLRNQGRQHETTWLLHNNLGYNYRMGEMNAALGLIQLQKLDEILALRESLASYYTKKLAAIATVILPDSTTNVVDSLFAMVIRVPENKRDGLVTWLNQHHIQSKPYFYPCIHLQPYFRSTFGYKDGDFPVAERISKQCVALPFFTSMTFEEIDRVVAHVAEYLD